MKDAEEESGGVKKAAGGRGGTGSKRTRAAEVHNLSERVSKTYCAVLIIKHIFPLISVYDISDCNLCLQRRRDRINEKMRALQELIPNCNKVGLDLSVLSFFKTPEKLC